jgi:hypothetical protein
MVAWIDCVKAVRWVALSVDQMVEMMVAMLVEWMVEMMVALLAVRWVDGSAGRLFEVFESVDLKDQK